LHLHVHAQWQAVAGHVVVSPVVVSWGVLAETHACQQACVARQRIALSVIVDTDGGAVGGNRIVSAVLQSRVGQVLSGQCSEIPKKL
jgi:hypothetical protein